jgi:hypothetical protein
VKTAQARAEATDDRPAKRPHSSVTGNSRSAATTPKRSRMRPVKANCITAAMTPVVAENRPMNDEMASVSTTPPWVKCSFTSTLN